MKVLLIRPRLVNYINSQSPPSFEDSIGLVPPLGIASIASVLEEKGHTASILDCEALCLSGEKIREAIIKYAPDVVGVSAITTNIHGALEACRLAKECGKIVVIGGSHMMVFPHETMTYDFIDYGICGEGEYAFLALLKALEEDDRDLFKGIKGLISRREGQITSNGIARIDNLDDMPFPAYHLLPLDNYEMVNSRKKIVSMFTTRGCPYQCGFCFRSSLLDKLRRRNPLRVVNEIEYVVREFGISHINFVDDTLTLIREHIEAICNELLKKNLRVYWQSPTRVDHVNPELLKLMYKAGCRALRFGVESGNEDILARIGKGTTIEQARNAFRWCREIGIDTVAYFIIGYIGETEETIKRTIAFSKEIGATYAAFFPATPMPKTKLFDMAAADGLVEPNYWEDFVLGKRADSLPFLFPDAGKWVAKAYREFYFRPSYIAYRLMRRDGWQNIHKYSRAAYNLLRIRFYR